VALELPTTFPSYVFEGARVRGMVQTSREPQYMRFRPGLQPQAQSLKGLGAVLSWIRQSTVRATRSCHPWKH